MLSFTFPHEWDSTQDDRSHKYIIAKRSTLTPDCHSDIYVDDAYYSYRAWIWV